jgi:hypothetical protein
VHSFNWGSNQFVEIVLRYPFRVAGRKLKEQKVMLERGTDLEKGADSESEAGTGP